MQTKPPEPGDRVRREIEDILARKDDDDSPLRIAAPLKPRKAKPSYGLGRVAPAWLMVLGLATLIIAASVTGFLVLPLALIGSGLLVYGYWTSIRRGRRAAAGMSRQGPTSVWWRGRKVQSRRHGKVVQLQDSWVDRLRRWFRARM